MSGQGEGRSTPRLMVDTFDLYRRYPLLFLALAAAVIVPYQLVALAVLGDRGWDTSDWNLSTEVLFWFDILVVSPLVSALHIHAVSEVRRGEEPRLLPIALRGLAALPVVCAAAIMSWLGFFGGLLLLIVPGLILWIRWYVAIQAAAIEREGWMAALRRSWALTEKAWGHVIVFFVCIVLVTWAPTALLGLGFDGESVTIASFVAEAALQVLLVSFTALATALLYYDLRSRREALAAESLAAGEASRT